jgi:proteic killer suppression protein
VGVWNVGIGNDSFMWNILLDKRHVTSYSSTVIKTFADKHTRELFITGKSRRIQTDLLRRVVRRLEYIDLATSLDDLKVPPRNRLHALKGDREGQYAISINDQWRICFRFQDGDAYAVEITDYH